MIKMFCDGCKKEIDRPITTVRIKLGNETYEDWFNLTNHSAYVNLNHLEGSAHLCFECSIKLATLLNKSISWIKKK